MFNFKKKLSPSLLGELQAYIDTYNHITYSADHTQCVEAAFDAIDDYYDASYVLADEEMCAPISTPPSVPKATDNAHAERMTARAIPSVKRAPERTLSFDDMTMLKQPTFVDDLLNIIDSKGLKDSKVYKKADIDRRLFSKIRSDSDYHPSRETAIKLCLALELDIADTEKLLEKAGYCLSMSSTGDLVIRYFIEHGEFNIVDINIALDYFSQPIL